MFKGVFVDDKIEEKKYAELLINNSNGLLNIEFRQPEHELTELADHLIEKKFDFAALDFRLDEVPFKDTEGNQQKNKYRASALAQQIRDRAIDDASCDLPLILLSQEDFITRIFHSDSTAEDLFDLVISKEELVTEKPLRLAANRIASLAAAYKFIQDNFSSKPIELKNLLGLNPHEAEAILNHQAIRAIDKIKYPHQVISKLMALLIQRPGILLTDEHLLARLAVSPDSPNINQLKDKLDKLGLSYSGVLHDGWPRWWWHRVEAWFKVTVRTSLGAIAGTERAARLGDALELKLMPAISKWTNSSSDYFWVACASCDHPTELKHSVLGYDVNYQPFFEPSRICWFCVQTGAYEKRGLEIDDSDRSLAEKIKSGQIQH
ncbi:MAG: hypothetical protein WC736_06865 [Gallionella sp.]